MPASKPINIQPKRILVITLRYLGDTLLVTPLISSLKQAYPHAEIDVLLPPGNVGMLEGNSDVGKLITLAPKPDLMTFARVLLRLYRRYDLAISTQGGDRPVLCAVLAGTVSMGFVSENATKDAWKRRLLSRSLAFGDGHTHAVLENLRFCKLLNIEPCFRITPPKAVSETAEKTPDGRYAVLHIMPQWRYKQWPAENWIKLAKFLYQQNCRIVLTGSGQEKELEALRSLEASMPPGTLNLAGKLALGELTAVIARARIFVGPDTGVTHLAAATGVNTIAIFGPTDPAKWGPWPVGYGDLKPPFASRGSKRVSNVYLVQGDSERGCVPCQLEGCDRNRESRSACLDDLSVERVIETVVTMI